MTRYKVTNLSKETLEKFLHDISSFSIYNKPKAGEIKKGGNGYDFEMDWYYEFGWIRLLCEILEYKDILIYDLDSINHKYHYNINQF